MSGQRHPAGAHAYLRTSASLVAALAAAGAHLAGCAAPVVEGSAASGRIVRRGDLEDRVLLTGELRAVHSRALKAPRTATWAVTIQWMAEEGRQVRPGDPVVEFDTSNVAADLEDKRLAVLEAEKQLEQTLDDLEIGRQQKLLELRQHEVARDLAAIEADVPVGLIPQRDYQDRQLALASAQAQVEKAARELETLRQGVEAERRLLTIARDKARRDLERAESSLDKLVLRAPVAGILLHAVNRREGRKWQNGDTCFPGWTVVEVPDLSEMMVETQLPDVDAGAVAPGMPARCRLDTYPRRTFACRLREVAEVAQAAGRDSNRRYFRVAVDLEESDPEIMRPGMSVKVEVLRDRWEDELLVPRESLDLAAEPPRLYLDDGSTTEVRVLGCGAVECAIDGPSEGLRLGRAP